MTGVVVGEQGEAYTPDASGRTWAERMLALVEERCLAADVSVEALAARIGVRPFLLRKVLSGERQITLQQAEELFAALGDRLGLPEVGPR